MEPRVLRRWLESGLVHATPEGTAEENFSIAVPPPNVTGALHMGHALNGSIQDALVRLNRMRGKRTKWILGTDHAGIATQRQVEKQLIGRGTSREEIGRDAFVAQVWEWRDLYGGQIIDQYLRLGATLDYSDERFTMDERYVQAVLKVFVELYEQGLIYRDNYMVNWDPGLRSAISDLEVEEREGVVDTLYEIAYPLVSGAGELVVATVRPETMLADTAVAVHPDDERYAQLVGQEAILPLVGRRLPIISDAYVKTEFGTGALKITPGHDPNDFEIGRRHGLEEIGVIGEDGLMTAAAGMRYAGLTVDEARERVVADLEAQGAIRGTQEYVHTVPYSHRSGARVEPLISLQWFMRMDELAQPAIDAVASGRVRVHPPSQSKRYLDWLAEIRPWCISRQLWWGHQIPVWYRSHPSHETYVGIEPPQGEGWEQDPDVLDTWFSSALWPFATLGWPEQTRELRAFYPTDVLVTARDILFLWVARMVMMGLRFAGDVPFDDVYVHSVIQAPDGRRMSKSLGTGIDPLCEIQTHGADAVRFGLLAMSSTQDVRYSAEKVQQGQALANKLYNATRFVSLRVGGDVEPSPRPRTVEDRWILSRLQAVKADTQARIDGFDFAKAALGLYDFIYGELCDWYLEIVKPRLGEDADPGDRAALAATLLHVLRETIAAAHPVIPFVTEELWGLLPGTEGLLATGRLPASDEELVDPGAEAQMGQAIEAIRILRGWRDSVGVRPGAIVPATLNAAGYEATADRDERAALGATLLHVLRETIATAHPVIPFVTEELWDLLGQEGLLAASRLPEPDDALRDVHAEAEIGRAIEAIKALRTWRDSVGIRPGAVVPAVLHASGYDATAGQVASLARFELEDAASWNGGARGAAADAEAVASVAIPGGTVAVLDSDALDVGAAERRLDAERERLRNEIARAEGKLANENFVAKAPPPVVEAERTKLAGLQSDLAALEGQEEERR
ncbi:MAG: valine--tRNA ligase [Actinomycetota bacterium]|nr:valine--tRNA ligase [Actinomycetota bacterium]